MVTPPSFNKRGYKISGWCDSSDKLVADTYKITQDVTFYAKWSPIQYKISFDKNGGSGTPPTLIQCEYDKDIKLPKNELTPPPTFMGRDGWSTSKEGINAHYYADEEIVKNLTYTDDATVTLYARYSEREFIIKFLDQDSKLLKQFDCNTGDTISEDELPELPRIYKDGYKTTGWYNTSDEKVDPSTITVTKSETYRAKESPIEYTLKFDKGTYTGSDISDILCEYDKEYTLPTNEWKKAGATVTGWKMRLYSYGEWTHYDSGAAVKNLTTIDGSVLTFLTDTAEAAISHTVTFESDKGVISEKEKTIKVDDGSKIYSLNAPSLSVSGYKLDGWYLKDTDTKLTYNDVTVTSDLTYVARWISRKVKISFEINAPSSTDVEYTNSDIDADEQTVDYGVATHLKPLPFYVIDYSEKTQQGGGDKGRCLYRFLGWSEDSAPGSGATLIADEGEYTCNAPGIYYENETVNLYAQWEKLPVTIDISIGALTSDSDMSCSYDDDTKIIDATLRGLGSGNFVVYLDNGNTAALTVAAKNDSAEIDPFKIAGLSDGVHSFYITAAKDDVTYSQTFIAKIQTIR